MVIALVVRQVKLLFVSVFSFVLFTYCFWGQTAAHDINHTVESGEWAESYTDHGFDSQWDLLSTINVLLTMEKMNHLLLNTLKDRSDILKYILIQYSSDLFTLRELLIVVVIPSVHPLCSTTTVGQIHSPCSLPKCVLKFRQSSYEDSAVWAVWNLILALAELQNTCLHRTRTADFVSHFLLGSLCTKGSLHQ